MFRTIATLFLLPAALGCRAANESRSPLCVVDMGSNSFRRIVGTFDGTYRQLALDVRTLGVGDDLSRHGVISDGKLAEIESTLAEFRSACEREQARPVVSIGTAAFRDAPNGRDVVARAAAAGVQMEIATEQRESELAYLVGSLGQPGMAVIDNGSRSIELVADEDGVRQHRVFNLGYRVAYDRFFASADNPATAIAAFRAALEDQAATASFMGGKKSLVGVEFGEMVEVLFSGDVEGRVFTREELQSRLQEITSLDAAGFQQLKQKEDIDRALPRLVAATFVVERFGYERIELTGRELGTGLIIEAGLRGTQPR